jgi:SAM-dependent methyltransferase
MPSNKREPAAWLWNRYYEDGNIPWRSGGLSAVAGELLVRFRPPQHTLLEIGCGTGNDSAGVGKLGFKYLGLDRSNAAIRQAARSGGPKAKFVWADFFEWTPAAAFGTVYDKGFFHSLGGVRRRNAFVRRVASILHSKGLWLTICGAADHRRKDFRHGAIYLRDLIGPAEVYFEVLEVLKAPYGLADRRHDFEAWHALFRRR